MDGKTLNRADFRRLFPAGTEELQLVFLPLVLPPVGGVSTASERDRDSVRDLRDRARSNIDPKVEALGRLLDEGDVKTIVFVQARATLHHLMRQLRGRRVAAVAGDRGWFGSEAASREEVIRAFAPRAQGASPPTAALTTDVLIATDLLSEGLNLQDAARVVHYDLPWSPARLAQRVGRIDRLGSSHCSITTVTFLPSPPLGRALTIEERLARKVGAQQVAGTNGRLDWCDQLGPLASWSSTAPVGCVAAVAGERSETVLVVRIGRLVEAIVVDGGTARTNPAAAARILSSACGATT